jgi:hypothetical protein
VTVPTPWDAIASPPAGAGPAAGAEVVTPAQDGNAERHRELAEHATQVRRLADELAAAIASAAPSAGLTSRGGHDQCCRPHRPRTA